MARQLRIEYAHAFYHITARGNAREAIYRGDEDRNQFLRLLAREVAQQGWYCYAYCLMDNHYHLLIETPEANLSRGMRRLNGVYTQAFNRRHKRVGHVLQGRYKSILVDKDSYFLELSRYVVLNPVRAGMVHSARAYRWSSYRDTAGLRPAPDWLAVSDMLKWFDQNPRRAMKTYQTFVGEGVDRESPWLALRGQIYLGSDEFVEKVKKRITGQSLENVPLMQSKPPRLTREELLLQVGRVYGVGREAIVNRDHSEACQMAVWLLRRVVNVPLKEVAGLFGISISRVSHIQKQMEGSDYNVKQNKLLRICKVKK